MPYVFPSELSAAESISPQPAGQGAGRGVDESESIAPIAASAASRMSSRRESAASRKRLAKASRRKWGKGGVGSVGVSVVSWGGCFWGRVRS